MNPPSQKQIRTVALASLLGATIVTILLEWLRAIEEPMDFGLFEIPGIPGMRMVVFSLILLGIILFRREGIMGTRELSLAGLADRLRKESAKGGKQA